MVILVVVLRPLAHPLFDRREGFPTSLVLLHSDLQRVTAEGGEINNTTVLYRSLFPISLSQRITLLLTTPPYNINFLQLSH